MLKTIANRITWLAAGVASGLYAANVYLAKEAFYAFISDILLLSVFCIVVGGVAGFYIGEKVMKDHYDGES